MSDHAGTQPDYAVEALPVLSWQSWPLREDRLRAALVLLGVSAAAVLVGWSCGRASLGLLAAGAIAVSMWRFFLPVLFEADHRGLSQWLFGRRRYIPWSAVARHQICAAGVLLLLQVDDDHLAPLRGLYVPWADHHEELLGLVDQHLRAERRVGDRRVLG
jgi:hypothetical protein